MKDGYYYFKKITNNSAADKSLGYICIRKSNQNDEYYIQCSLNKDKIRNLINGNVIDLYISPAHYVTNGSHLISRLIFSPKDKLFADLRIPEIYFNFTDDSQYILATCNSRTILYSEIYKKPVTEENILTGDKNPEAVIAEISEKQKNNLNEIVFDPFNTTNTSYEWKIISNINTDQHLLNKNEEGKAFGNDTPLSSNDIAKYLESLNIAYDYFGKMTPNNTGLTSDTFLKMAFSAYRISGHLLIGKYTDSQSHKVFNIIGLPGINALRNIKRKRKRKQIIPPIQNYARWMFAINKPEKSFRTNFNGYWLYYFNLENGNPVKPVIKS